VGGGGEGTVVHGRMDRHRMRRSQNGGLRLRPCRPADAAAVLALWKRAEAIPSVTDNIAAVRRRLRREPQLFLLAWDGPQLVGSIIGGWDGWRASIARLAIAPAYRRPRARKAARGERRETPSDAGCYPHPMRCRSEERESTRILGAVGYQLSRAEVTYVKDLR
jgi:hypothetical protein